MTNCLNTEQIVGLVDGTLSPEAQQRVASHLEGCPLCRERVVKHQRAVQKSGESPMDPQRPNGHQADTIVPELNRGGSTMGDAQLTAGDYRTLGFNRIPGLDVFVQNLSLSGLLTAEEVDHFLSDLTESPKDAPDLAEKLIEAKKLTRYQAEALLQGQVRGLILGKYALLAKIGEGGKGMVYAARHRLMNRTVALKVLAPVLTQSPDAINRFHREVEAAGRLTHPNIAAAYDADKADGVHFLVMELVDGPNLSAYIKENGPLPVAAAVQLILQAAHGLAHAHELGIVHRDIKPGNVLVNQQGTVKILDMGLAQFGADAESSAADLTNLTQTGRAMGTVDYMAPEQALNAKTVDQRADIYSLGCTLNYLLTGLPMSPEGTLTQKLLWHQNEAVTPLTQLRDDIPESLNACFLKMCAKSPADRQQSMDEVIDELQHCLSEFSTDGLEALPLIGASFSTGLATSQGSVTRQGPTYVDPRTLLEGRRGSKPALAAGGLGVGGEGNGRTWMIGGAVAALLALVAVGVWMTLFRPADLTPDGVPVAQVPPATTPPVEGAPTVPDGNQPPQTPDNPGAIVPPPALPPRDPGNAPATGTPGDQPPNQGTQVAAGQPYLPLLSLVFESRGAVTLGDEVYKDLGAIPRGATSLRGVSFEKTSVQDDDLLALCMLDEARLVTSLSLAGTAITDGGLALLPKMSNLRTLDLSGTKISNDATRQIALLNQLTDLNLQNTSVTDQGMANLARLARLEQLYLSETSVGDAGLQLLEPLKGLRTLAINGTLVRQAGHDAIKTALPTAEILWDGADVEKQIASRFLDKGAVLALVTRSKGTLFEDITSKENLPAERFHVIHLDLSGSAAVTSDDLKSLAGLAKLQTLALEGTSVTSAGLAHLHGLQSLTALDLGAMPVNETSVAELQSAIPKLAISQRNSADQKAAFWVLQQGGKVGVVNKDGRRFPGISATAGLPMGEFRLFEVSLAGAAIGDDDLANLRDLPSLEALFLNGTQVTSESLSQLVASTGLRDLNLSDTKVTAAGLMELKRFTGLRQLYLDGIALSEGGLGSLAPLTGLTHLSLARSGMDDPLLVDLKFFPQLIWLNLAGTEITDAGLSHLMRLKNLTTLDVRQTELSDAGIEDLKGTLGSSATVEHDELNPDRQIIRWVLMKRGAVETADGPIVAARQIPREACQVTKIDLAEIENLPLDDLDRVLAAAAHLQSLNLSKTSIGDAQLAHIVSATGLKQLFLADTKVTAAMLASLSTLKQLELLDVRNTRVDGPGLAKVKDLPALKHLFLSSNGIDDQALLGLKEATGLVSLDLSYNTQISDQGAQQLAGLENLEGLGLRNTDIGDAGMEPISKLAKLKHLDLSGAPVTDAGAARLAGLKELTYLNLSNSAITDGALSRLGALKNLQTLEVSRTKVTAPAIAAFKTATGGKCVVHDSTTPDRPAENPNGFPTAPAAGRFP